MVLSDREINLRLYGLQRHEIAGLPPHKGDPLVIDPLDESQIQPASIDLTLDDEFRFQGPEENRERTVMERERGEGYYTPDLAIDLAHVSRAFETWPLEHETVDSFRLEPGEFVLGSTAERVEIPDDLCARVEGKSSLGRLGLLVHLTAGYIDPGFKGKITLEIVNVNGDRPIILRPGMPICQLSLIQLTSSAERPYGHESRNSKYQNQTTVQGSRYDG